jgi:hypothetical protein
MSEITEIEQETVEVVTTDLIATTIASEHQVKVGTAKRYPRSIKSFRQQVFELSCIDEETAGSCFYVLPRAGKTIEGPSVRFAEIIASSWGNLQFGARVIAVDDQWITAQGVCYDYEKNNSCSFEVRRRITNKNGVKFNDDMIQTTGRAACAIAFREAVFKIIPRPFWQAAFEQAKITSIGKGKTMAKMREDCLATFKKAGVTDKQVLTFLNKPGIEDITTDDLISLRGIWTAAKDEGVSVERLLMPQHQESEKVEAPKIK